MSDGIHGIYLKRDYYRDGNVVTITIQAENVHIVAKVSEECLLTALRNDLNMEVGE